MITKKGEFVLRSILPAAAAALLVSLPQPGLAQASASQAPAAVKQAIPDNAGELKAFYAARRFAPLWLDDSGRPSEAADKLLAYLKTAQFDNIDAKALAANKLEDLVERARAGKPADAAKAEIALSRTFAAYVRAMRGAVRDTMLYESVALQPRVPSVPEALASAAASASLAEYVGQMAWMHPLYAPLRAAMTDPRYTETQRQQIWTNLKRVRAIPATSQGRQVLVDAAGAHLWMYEDGKPVDTMKVVVGKGEMPTPMMAGLIRRAIVNPYWLVPDDLVQTNIAPNVLSRGVKYLKSEGYQVLADWSDDAPLVDPKKVDWQAVKDGLVRVHVRQLPGRSNFMGKVKFEFPNAQGIYLHDTPAKDLMEKDARQYSSGCVRLEDAERLGRWLLNGPLPTSKTPERSVPLATPVPVYITYLTALPEPDGQIAFQADPYKRDEIQLASMSSALLDRP